MSTTAAEWTMPKVNRSAERADFLATIITTALEGGIGYWSQALTYKWWYPELSGGTAVHRDGEANAYAVLVETDPDEENEDAEYRVSVDLIASALRKFHDGPIKGLAEEYRKLVVAADVTNDGGDIDAEAADWIVQVACFGEVVYG